MPDFRGFAKRHVCSGSTHAFQSNCVEYDEEAILNRLSFLVILAALAGLLGVQAASAQTVSVVSGNGQAICPGCFGSTNVQFQLLTAQVVDSTGAPLSGQTVNW